MNDKPITPEEDALNRFIDGVLGEDDKLDLLDRFAERADMAERVESYQHQNHLLRALRRGLDVGDSRQFCPDLQAQIVQQLVQRPWWRHPVMAAMAASVAVVAISGSFFYAGISHKPITKADPVNETVVIETSGDELAVSTYSGGMIPPGDRHFPFSAYATATSDTVTGVAEQPLVWFNNQMINNRIRQPDLSGHGLMLVDIKAWAEKPTPALHLSYRDQAGKPVELYAGILSKKLIAAFDLVPEGHISIHWQLNNLMFAIIAPFDSPQLFDIVATVSSAVEMHALDEAGPVERHVEGVRNDQAVSPSASSETKSLGTPITNDGTVDPVQPMRPEIAHGDEVVIPVEPPQARPPGEAEEKPEQL